jgi:hypothetical protein
MECLQPGQLVEVPAFPPAASFGDPCFAYGLRKHSARQQTAAVRLGDRATLTESLQFIQRTATQILSAISPTE